MGIETTVLVAQHLTDDPLVQTMRYGGGPFTGYLRDHVADWALWLQKSRNPAHRSINVVPSGALSQVESATDIVHLHWIGRDMLSIAEIGRIRRPVIWNLHDAWAFAGAEHHPQGAADFRYRDGYLRSNRNPGSSRFDLDGWVWRRKHKHLSEPFQLVAPSEHMRQQAAGSAIAGNWPIRVIPNPVDTDVFMPGDSGEARSALGLPKDAKVIAVAGDDGPLNGSKGWELLVLAFRQLSPEHHDAIILVFGATPDAPLVSALRSLTNPVKSLGRLHDAKSVAHAYRAADLVAVPSRIESFSQVAAEGQACGKPIIAFRSSGLLDVVANEHTGSLVTPFETDEFAAQLNAMLSSEERRSTLGRQAAERARTLWSYQTVGRAFADLYAEVLSRKT
jgi:glycosyltransferase involved in cell wall biosynthesis